MQALAEQSILKPAELLTSEIVAPTGYEDVFSDFYFVENTSGDAVTKRLVPSFRTMLVFSFGEPVDVSSKQFGDFTLSACSVLGPLKQPFDYTLHPGAELLAVNFKGDAFYRFFGQPGASDSAVHPDELIGGKCFSGLWEALNDLSGTGGRVEQVLAFAGRYLRKSDATLNRILEFSQGGTALNPVKAIAGEVNRSERSIQLKFQRMLGYSAKELGRYERFRKAFRLLGDRSGTQRVDWFDIVTECGYYDQSQLIRDFRHFIDLSPGRFLRADNSVCLSKIF